MVKKTAKTNHFLCGIYRLFVTLHKSLTMNTDRKFSAIILLIILFYPVLSFSQSWSRFDIGDSGCSAAFPYEPEWESSYSQDSSYLWIGEVFENDIYFGVICVEFAQPFSEGSTRDDLILTAEIYLDYLQAEFSIVSHTGYEKQYSFESDDDACGVSDNWQDNEGDPWYIQTWIDPFNMVVLYMYSDPDHEMDTYRDYFFESFLFPEY